MKKSIVLLIPVLFLGFILLGCDDNNNSSDGRTLTENDFSRMEDLEAKADRDRVVMMLEPPVVTNTGGDTSDAGIDTFNYRYSETVNQRFCWDDLEEGAAHEMVLTDSEGAEVLSVQANGECVEAVIPPGIYEVTLIHDNVGHDVAPVFIVPMEVDEFTQGQGTLGDIYRLASEFLGMFSISNTSHAQSVQKNIHTLVNCNECTGCDLKGADLNAFDLSFADLKNANLTRANLKGAQLAGADFQNANLTNANLSNADIAGTNFSGATLSGANCNNAMTDTDTCSTCSSCIN